MRLSGGNIWIGLAVAGVGLYAVVRVSRGARAVTDSIGITRPDLGPNAQLTQSARGREADMIRAGYLVRLDNGATQITDAGEEYIEQQRQLQESLNSDGPLQTQIVFR